MRVDGRRAPGSGASRVRVRRSRASPRRGYRARDARLGSGGSGARWVARQARSRKRHAPFGAVALRIFCDPRVTRAALVHDAERDAAASRAPSASLRAVARVQPAQTRPAFATARTGARARTDPLETRTPRAVPIGTGAVTRHAPSVAASIASSSLLVSKGGRLESRRPAGRRGRVCGRREGGGDWVSSDRRDRVKSAREKAIFSLPERNPNDARERAHLVSCSRPINKSSLRSSRVAARRRATAAGTEGARAKAPIVSSTRRARVRSRPIMFTLAQAPSSAFRAPARAGKSSSSTRVVRAVERGGFLVTVQQNIATLSRSQASLSHHDHPPATQPHLIRRLHRARGRGQGARRDLRQMQPGKVTRLAFAF